jgi:hypothetical protein
MGWCKVGGGEGAKALADLVMFNTTLRTLDLRGNSLGDDGKRAAFLACLPLFLPLAPCSPAPPFVSLPPPTPPTPTPPPHPHTQARFTCPAA